MECPKCGFKGVRIVNFIPLISHVQVVVGVRQVFVKDIKEDFSDDDTGSVVQCVSCKYSAIKIGRDYSLPSEFK